MKHSWWTGRNLAYGILIYYWILRGMLNIDLPEIFPPAFISFITAGSVGWLIRDYDGDSGWSVARSLSPRLLTSWGDFSWDGVTESVNADGVPYCLYYGGGCNYDGYVERGDIVIAAPKSHVVEMGRHRLIKTRLSKGTLPTEVSSRVMDARVILTGSTFLDDFGESSPNDVSVERQYEASKKLNAVYTGFITEMNNVLATGAQVGQMLNPADAFRRELKEALEGVNE